MVILAADDVDKERQTTGMQLVSQGRVLQPLQQSLDEEAGGRDHEAATHSEIDRRRRAGEWGKEYEADGDGKFEVEKVVGSRVRDGNREYKLKWKGYGERDSSWRTAVKVPECWEIIIEYWERRAKAKKINWVQGVDDLDTSGLVASRGKNVSGELGLDGVTEGDPDLEHTTRTSQTAATSTGNGRVSSDTHQDQSIVDRAGRDQAVSDTPLEPRTCDEMPPMGDVSPIRDDDAWRRLMEKAHDHSGPSSVAVYADGGGFDMTPVLTSRQLETMYNMGVESQWPGLEEGRESGESRREY
jgi:hypothetical protein